MIVGETARQLFAGTAVGDTYLAEAAFGLSQVAPFLDSLPEGSRVLEVGAGPCIALEAIASARPDLFVQGIEPLGAGFAHFDRFIDDLRVAAPNFRLFRGGYEDFNGDAQWDFIFLVNVFEHLPDWKHFLDFVATRISIDGTCLILCPNYGFPYESHFRVPIVGGKSGTRLIHANYIRNFETRNDLDGLYASLNFVRLRKVRRETRKRNLKLTVDPSIINEMIDRLDDDPAFAQRQRGLAPMARAVRRSRLFQKMLRWPMVQDALPYMKLLIERGDKTNAPVSRT
jgi:SAM-dependent methyltransferase